jgi:hypothetical protein
MLSSFYDTFHISFFQELDSSYYHKSPHNCLPEEKDYSCTKDIRDQFHLHIISNLIGKVDIK